jgi:hypothetical protein
MHTTLKFPNDILRLLYMVFFKPFTLEQYFRKINPTLSQGLGLIKFWRHRKTRDELRAVVLLTLFNIIATATILNMCVALFLSNWFPVNWLGVLLGIVGSIIIGLSYSLIDVIAGLTISMVIGLTVSVQSGIACTKCGVAAGLNFDPLLGIGYGITAGAVMGIAFGLMLPKFNVLWSNRTGWVILALLTIIVQGGFSAWEASGAIGKTVGTLTGVSTGVMGIIAFIVSYYGLFFYLIFLVVQWGLLRVAQWTSQVSGSFHLSPMLYDETIWFPLFGLDQHLITIGKHNRQDAQQPIALVAQSFRQQWAATNALIELSAYDVERAQGIQGIANIAEQFTWLPPTMPKDLENVLPPIREIAEYVRGAMESDTLWNKQTQLRNAKSQTTRVREGLALSSNRKIAARFGQALQTWEQVFDKELLSLQTLEAIPNVYVAGSPLASTAKVFKGRRDLYVALERELATPAEQRPTLLLFGARRSGKTSVIKQMPNRLGPNVVPVEIDLQSATAAEDASGLLAYIADQVKTNALNYRRIQLPALPREELRGDPYMTFLNWLTRVEEIVGDKWILLNLDEYEHITQAMEQHRLDERVFQFLRGIIQHHPRVTILLSGSHTLEDLPSIWSNYLINVRVLRIGALKEDEARELIVKPIDDFPLQYEPAAVDRIIQVTGCQPYLVQATCRDLVNALNEANRMTATLADVDRALDEVLTSSVAYFQDLWGGRDSDDTQRAIMRAVARNENVETQNIASLQPALRKLTNRDVLHVIASGKAAKQSPTSDSNLEIASSQTSLLAMTYRYRVELVRRWVERNAS